jgi:hypothetical protein
METPGAISAMHFFQQMSSKTFGDMIYLIHLTRKFHASDPQDKLYALLGITTAFELSVQVDYNKSVAEVYREFTGVFLERSDSLDSRGNR